MKLVFDCERMKYPYTGLYEYCYQLGFALQKFFDNKDLCYYIPASRQGAFGPEHKQIIQKSSHKFFPISTKTDIWHTTFQVSNYMKNNNRGKKVLTIHDLNFLYERLSEQKRNKYLKLVQSNIERADHLVAISQYVKQDVLTHLDVKDKPFDVVYNGSKVLEFENFQNPLYKPVRPFLFSIGTVLPKKNFHVLPCLLQHNDLELIIAGKKDRGYADHVMEMASKFGVEDRVRLIGPVSYEDKYWYLKNCEAFMFPSIAEGFGIPVIEAMHFGKPVFLSRFTSLPEVGGNEAYYFENFDSEYMQHIFEQGMNDYINNNRAESIMDHASLFSWERCAQEYYNVYQQVMQL